LSKMEDLQLPPEVAAKFLSFLHEENGQFQLADKEGLVRFVAEHGEQYPELLELFSLDKDALVDHFHKTGEVLPGTRIIHTAAEEGSNVTKLEVFTSENTRKT